VAVRDVHLDRKLHRAARGFRGMPLRQRRLACVSQPLVLHPRGLHDEELRGLVREHHLRDHVLYELVLPDRLTERLALAGIFDRALQARADDPTRPGGDREAPLIERVHRDLETLAFLADQILRRNLDVLEEELTGRAAARELLAVRLRNQPALLLLLGRVPEKRQRVESDVDGDQRAERSLAALDLFTGERLADEVEAGTTVLLGNDDSKEAELG